MKVFIIAVYKENKTSECTQYRLFDSDANSFMDVNTNALTTVLKDKRLVLENAKLNEQGEIVGSNGSLKRYPYISSKGVVNGSAATVLNRIDKVGYTVADMNGTVTPISNEDLTEYVKNNGITNGKLVTKDGKPYISAIVGSYPVVQDTQSKKVPKKETSATPTPSSPQSKPGEVTHNIKGTTEGQIYRVPGLISGRAVSPGDSKLGEMSAAELPNNTGGLAEVQLPVSDKMAAAMLAMDGISPLLYHILLGLSRVESNELDTMGVTTTTLYYNAEFVKTLKLSELVWVLAHEASHVAMRHRIRRGTRDPRLFNYACDYYINAVLTEEFELDMSEAHRPSFVSHNSTRGNRVGISFWAPALYNPNTSVREDTPETIYEELKQDARNQQGQGGNGDQSQQSDGGSGDQSQQGSGDFQGGKTRKVYFRGQEDEVSVENHQDMDILDDDKTAEMSAKEQSHKIKSLIQNAQTSAKKYTKAGSGEALRQMICDVVAPRVNWTSLVRRFLTQLGGEINTYSRPDRRFISRGMIIPGVKEVDGGLEDIVIAIDMSGSITDKELATCLNQLMDLMKRFKCAGTVMLWTCKIEKVFRFESVDDILKEKSKGTFNVSGGTSPRCIFEEFERKDYVMGRKKRPSLIIVFSDGCFYSNELTESPFVVNDYSKGVTREVKSIAVKYGRKTIWVVPDDFKFEAPFGYKASFSPPN